MDAQMAVDFGMLYILPFLLISVLGMVFWLWMLIECLTKESSEGNDKLIWALVILLTSFVGAAIYFFVRRPTRMSSNHCFLRYWRSTLLVSLTLAITTSGVLLWLLPESSSIVAYLQVKSKPPKAVFADTDLRLTPKDFEVFQQTQLALLKSTFVLNAALSRPEIVQLDAVRKEEPEPIPWLQNKLRVSFPGEGEILEVRYDGGEEPEEMKVIVDAVIDAYAKDVLHKERTRNSEVRSQLANLHQETKSDLKQKITEYEKLANQQDGTNSVSVEADINMLLADLRMNLQEINAAKKGLVDQEVAKQSIRERLTKLEADHEKMMDRLKQHGARTPLLQMMEQEIEQQREIERSITARLQDWNIECEAAQDRIQSIAPATVAIKSNQAQRVLVAGAGGLAVFCLACLGSVLVGCCTNRQKRDTSDENC